GDHRTFSSARRLLARRCPPSQKGAPRCRTSYAGLPTNPANNYHSAVQPENIGCRVNRLPGRKPMTAVAFTINGKAVNVEAEPDTALLWVVREHLKLTGTKYGCGLRPVRRLLVPALLQVISFWRIQSRQHRTNIESTGTSLSLDAARSGV